MTEILAHRIEHTVDGKLWENGEYHGGAGPVCYRVIVTVKDRADGAEIQKLLEHKYSHLDGPEVYHRPFLVEFAPWGL